MVDPIDYDEIDFQSSADPLKLKTPEYIGFKMKGDKISETTYKEEGDVIQTKAQLKRELKKIYMSDPKTGEFIKDEKGQYIKFQPRTSSGLITKSEAKSIMEKDPGAAERWNWNVGKNEFVKSNFSDIMGHHAIGFGDLYYEEEFAEKTEQGPELRVSNIPLEYYERDFKTRTVDAKGDPIEILRYPPPVGHLTEVKEIEAKYDSFKNITPEILASDSTEKVGEISRVGGTSAQGIYGYQSEGTETITSFDPSQFTMKYPFRKNVSTSVEIESVDARGIPKKVSHFIDIEREAVSKKFSGGKTGSLSMMKQGGSAAMMRQQNSAEKILELIEEQEVNTKKTYMSNKIKELSSDELKGVKGYLESLADNKRVSKEDKEIYYDVITKSYPYNRDGKKVYDKAIYGFLQDEDITGWDNQFKIVEISGKKTGVPLTENEKHSLMEDELKRKKEAYIVGGPARKRAREYLTKQVPLQDVARDRQIGDITFRGDYQLTEGELETKNPSLYQEEILKRIHKAELKDAKGDLFVKVPPSEMDPSAVKSLYKELIETNPNIHRKVVEYPDDYVDKIAKINIPEVLKDGQVDSKEREAIIKGSSTPPPAVHYTGEETDAEIIGSDARFTDSEIPVRPVDIVTPNNKKLDDYQKTLPPSLDKLPSDDDKQKKSKDEIKEVFLNLANRHNPILGQDRQVAHLDNLVIKLENELKELDKNKKLDDITEQLKEQVSYVASAKPNGNSSKHVIHGVDITGNSNKGDGPTNINSSNNNKTHMASGENSKNEKSDVTFFGKSTGEIMSAGKAAAFIAGSAAGDIAGAGGRVFRGAGAAGAGVIGRRLAQKRADKLAELEHKRKMELYYGRQGGTGSLDKYTQTAKQIIGGSQQVTTGLSPQQAAGQMFAQDTKEMMGGGQSTLSDFGKVALSGGSALTDMKERFRTGGSTLTDMGARAVAGGSTLTDFSGRVGGGGGAASALGGALSQQMTAQGGTRGIFTSGKEFLESRGQPTSLRIMGQRERDASSFSIGGTLGLGSSMRPEQGLGSPSGFRQGELISRRRRNEQVSMQSELFGQYGRNGRNGQSRRPTQTRAPNGSSNGQQRRTGDRFGSRSNR